MVAVSSGQAGACAGGPPPRPTGREAVRRSILRAARRRFAREGGRASLRTIAEDAGVNVGLIHRHFGRKDELIREVIDDAVDAGLRYADPAGGMGAMFLQAAEDTEFMRMIAWLSLESGPDGASPLADAPRRTIDAVRSASLHPGPDRDARLMTALTVIYGWSLLRREVLSAFGVPDDRRAEVERRIAALLTDLTREVPP